MIDIGFIITIIIIIDLYQSLLYTHRGALRNELHGRLRYWFVASWLESRPQ